MIETFTALLFAHALADFVLQTDWMHRNKSKIGVMALHGVVVLVLSSAAIGHLTALPVIALAAAHLAIDCIKTYGKFRNFAAFITDQALHIVTLIAVSLYAPTLWQTGFWMQADSTLATTAITAMAFLSGLIITLFGGQYAVGTLMQNHSVRLKFRGLKNGGRQIGLLERGLIFFFVLSGQPLGVGFLVAAKSILRFGTASSDQKTAEYVIIGTLASFGWAFLAARATLWLMNTLPPLEVLRLRP